MSPSQPQQPVPQQPDPDGSPTTGSGPGRREAHDRLVGMEHLDEAVRAAGRRYARFLLGLGAISMLWFVSLAWLATSDTGVLVSAIVFGVALAGLCVGLLPGAQASRRGFTRRWLLAMGLWGLCFAVFLTAGLLWNRDETFYWLLAAPLVAGPAFIGAQVEGRA